MPGEDEGTGFGAGRVVDPATELKKWADTIKATAEAIDAATHTIDSNATRSVVLEINNTTSRTLILYGKDHDHGDFRELPPDAIPPRTSRLFTSQNGHPLEGTSGNVQYRVDDDGTLFHIEWDNPLVGENECDCRVDGAHIDFYLVDHVNGGGNTGAKMRFLLGERADTNKKESDWRTCGRCKTLVFALDDGHCAAHDLGIVAAPSDYDDVIARPSDTGVETAPPGGFGGLIAGGRPSHAGVEAAPSPEMLDQVQRHTGPDPDPRTAGMEQFGKHEPAGYTFQLPYGFPGPNREEGWRKCAHCKGLFYDGEDSKGVCPGRRGGHQAESNGHEIQLRLGVPPDPSQQSDWRFCDQCFGLFYLPHNADGICLAGGSHHANSDSYVLDRAG
jgi:hypothetical protein